MRSTSNHAFTIKAFGNDKACHSVAELKSILVAEYLHQSVAVHFTAALSGLRRVLFIDVEEDAIRMSYGERPVVNFQELTSEALIP